MLRLIDTQIGSLDFERLQRTLRQGRLIGWN
jgi:hypothetical protein